MVSKINVYGDMLKLYSSIKILRGRYEKVMEYQEKVEGFYKDPTMTILLPTELRWLLYHLDGFNADFGNVIEIPEKYIKQKKDYIENEMGVDDFEEEFKDETREKFEKNIKEKSVILHLKKEDSNKINDAMTNVIKDEYEVEDTTAKKIVDNINQREVKPLKIGNENKRTIEEVIKLISDRIGIAIKTGKVNMNDHKQFGIFLQRQKQTYKMLYPHLKDKIDIIYDQMIKTTKKKAEVDART